MTRTKIGILLCVLTASPVGVLAQEGADARQDAATTSQRTDERNSKAREADARARHGDGDKTIDAQDRRGTPDDTGSDPSNDEVMFYRPALASGAAEVRLSEHATRHAQSPQVRAFAEMLVRDHSALNDKLKAASALTSPPSAKPDDAKAAAAVMQKRGAGYDAAWLQHMDKAHAKSIALYAKTSREAERAETRELAQAALPTLRSHAQQVQALRKDAPQTSREAPRERSTP